VLDASGNPIYDTVEERVLTGYTWEEKVTRYRTDTKTLGASDGEWRDTGVTFTETWFSSKPTPSPGYRWVETSRGYTFGIWTTTTFKEQVNRIQVYQADGWTVTPNYRTEEYRVWNPRHRWVEGRLEFYQERVQTGTRLEPYQVQIPGRYVTIPKWSPGYYANTWEQYWDWWSLSWRWRRTRVWIPGQWRATQVWIPAHTVTRYRTVPIYEEVTRSRYIPGYWVGAWETRTRSVLTGYTATKQTSYSVWETKSAPTLPVLYKPGTLTPRDDIRNIKEVYTTTIKQVPRTRVETYKAFRTYDYSGTSYSFLPWGEKQVTVTAIPRNSYTGDVHLQVEAGTAISATLDSSVLSFSSPASTVLRMTPNHVSARTITVNAFDSNGRLVESHTYELNLTESLPSDTVLIENERTTVRPDSIPPTITETTTSEAGVPMPEEPMILQVPKLTGGPVYDGGSGPAGPITRLYTVDPMTGEYIYISVAWAEGRVTRMARGYDLGSFESP